jgi:hypothetical protein
MDPAALMTRLNHSGLTVLTVLPHHSEPGILIVYLHSWAGDHVNGRALQVIQSVPGVIGASQSVETPSIIHVVTDPTATGPPL